MLAVFDFDHTIVDGNSDIVARNLITPSILIPNSKNYPHNWTQYMQQVFNVIKSIKIPAQKIIDAVSLMSPTEGMLKLIRALYKNDVDIIVASDSNSLFIQNWLKYNKLSGAVSCIYTNPAKIEDDLIIIEPYTLQRACTMCNMNMCKGTIVKEHLSRKNKKYENIFYFGDGKNDLCPVLKLSQMDVAFPRLGYILDNLLKSRTTLAKVKPWRTGDDIYEYLVSLELISANNV
jgi:pyridoxal phosphate phosphatase PHOSPHO2